MIKEAIGALISGRSLTMEEAASVMEEIMQGEVTPAQFGAFVTALRLKGETVDEITGLASVMRARAIPVTIAEPAIDIVGTGGDNASTFNISNTIIYMCVYSIGRLSATYYTFVIYLFVGGLFDVPIFLSY